MGFILAIAVGLETFIVIPFFVPAILSLLGKANWWPFKPETEMIDFRTTKHHKSGESKKDNGEILTGDPPFNE